MLKPVKTSAEYLHGAEVRIVDQLISEMEVGAVYIFRDLHERYCEISGLSASRASVARALASYENMERDRASVDGVQYRVWRRTK